MYCRCRNKHLARGQPGAVRGWMFSLVTRWCSDSAGSCEDAGMFPPRQSHSTLKSSRVLVCVVRETKITSWSSHGGAAAAAPVRPSHPDVAADEETDVPQGDRKRQTVGAGPGQLLPEPRVRRGQRPAQAPEVENSAAQPKLVPAQNGRAAWRKGAWKMLAA